MDSKEFYDSKHVICPACKSDDITMTCMGIVPIKNDKYIDNLNTFICNNCGNKGLVINLKSKNKKENEL